MSYFTLSFSEVIVTVVKQHDRETALFQTLQKRKKFLNIQVRGRRQRCRVLCVY